MGKSRFEYGFDFAEKIESEIVKIGFRSLIETAEANFFLLEFPFSIYIFL
jgi:hypothetical protein